MTTEGREVVSQPCIKYHHEDRQPTYVYISRIVYTLTLEMQMPAFNLPNIKILLLVGVVLATLFYISVLVGGGATKFLDGFTGLGQTQNTFTMYYMNGCPHCESVLPDYRTFVASGQVETDGKKTTIRMLEQGDPSAAPELEANNVKGFPTFILSTAGGENIEYKGERTVEAMKEFISKNSS